ncbi:exosome RNA helicase MTR4-like [Watersipora subatra]|uniref:exosome RNA helicase MTR4-like n=1 Tax=Watersipora subatra TaxID=2589382 RepID=UPI00355B961B
MADINALFDVFDAGDETSASSAPEVAKVSKGKSGKTTTDILKRHREEISESHAEETKKLKMAVVDEVRVMDNLPRLQLHQIETMESCTHEVALPPHMQYKPLKPSTGPPAKEYPFILDPFQKESILCLENQESVLVSAHTSAGKTVVALYAIATSLKAKQRVIYTSPIKALSNQKFRELSEEFGDVGLMTGDVTINPSASCLVMTTEILRSMLYRGSEIMREVAWVIFDEIHYMRDKDRGVVWEETIILLPDNVHFVFLSATIPNASQFAEWIAHLHQQPCHVVYTDYRPTPLQHYIYPAGGDGLHLVVDEQGNFREENFNTAMASLLSAGENSHGDQKGRRGGIKGESNCFRIIKMIMERNFAPVIVFSFSKKDCEAYALQMTKIEFNTPAEKKLVEEVFTNAIDTLSEEDKKLPQVEHVLPLLKKGIGIHHSGLLPLLKETIEILFAEGLIKALFATETFAMGLNMPARTVVFTSARKFDGKDYRWVSSGEYIQMSGRAGRRGLDDRGIVIQMIDDRMSPATAKTILQGKADPLDSAFHLTYNMVLNLLRVEEINPEYMLERSFYQFQNYASLPRLTDQLKSLEVKHNSIKVEQEELVFSYYKIREQLEVLSESLLTFVHKPKYLVSFLQPGRLLYIKHNDKSFGWAAVVNFHKKVKKDKYGQEETIAYTVEVLMNVCREAAQSKDIFMISPPENPSQGEMQVVPVLLNVINKVSAIRLYLPSDLRSRDNRHSVLKSIQEVEKRFQDGLPLLDPVLDMGIKDPMLKEIVQKIEAFENRMYTHELHKKPQLPDLLKVYDEKQKIAKEIKSLKAELKKKRSLLQMDELKCRKRVLRRLGYATSADAIELKGRVACEISAADELLMTELLFNGVFNDLEVSQVCALVSCFVFEEKCDVEATKLSEELSGPLRIMQDTARRIAKVSKEAKLDIDEDAYVQKFGPAMMDVVSAWCKGQSFAQICKMTDIFEGSIIRCMRRLEETLRELCNAAKAIGNASLENKFSEGIRLIKRDIVFAASLYL